MTAKTKLRLLPAAALILLACPAPGRAQQDVMRDVYRFYGPELQVRVATESAGRIRLVRGEQARIEVAARAPHGFASAALGGTGVPRLTLTSLGGDHVDFVVVVPERVRVRVEWPASRRSELFGTLSETATYDWDSTEPRPAIETIRPDAPARPAEPAAAPVTAPPVTRTPRFLDVLHAARAERITLRIEQGAFAIAPAHLIQTRGDGDGLRFDAPDVDEVVIHLPAQDRMTLRLDGRDAVIVDGAEVRLLCEAILSQTLPDGSRWLTITPAPRGGCAVERDREPFTTTPAARRT